MSKTISFTVTLNFSEKITSDDDVNTIAENIAKAIKHEANSGSIVPDDSDAYTKSVEVRSEFFEGEVYLDIYNHYGK